MGVLVHLGVGGFSGYGTLGYFKKVLVLRKLPENFV